MITPEGSAGEPVTFHVYTPQDITSRRPMRSMPSLAPPPKKTSVAAWVGLGFVGVIVVLLTAAAVVAVSTDEPSRPAPSAASSLAPMESAEPPAESPPAAPSVISIGDPIDDEPSVAPADDTPSQPVPVGAKPRPKPTSSDEGWEPPPNPYGN